VAIRRQLVRALQNGAIAAERRARCTPPAATGDVLMNSRKYLGPVRALVATRALQRLSRADGRQLLSRVGLARPRSRGLASSWMTAGVVLAGAAAVLFGTSRGRDLRTRLGSGAGGWLGEVVGRVIGAHPLKTERALEAARQTFGSSRA
jgi:hypothetical protein